MPTKVIVARPVKGAEQKNRGRLTVASATGDEEERTRSIAAFRRRTQRLKGHVSETKEKLAREVVLPETITIQELANRMSERAVDVIKLMMKQGQMAKITDVIDADTAQLIAEELGHTVKRVAESDVEEGLFDTPDADGHQIAAAACRHHHGPCRSRQDLAARCDPPRQCRLGRGGRHHPAHRRLSDRRAQRHCRSLSSTRPATRRSRRCARAAPRSPTSSSWWLRPMMASCRRRRRPSRTPVRPMCRSSWRSTRSTSPTPSRSACATNCCNTRCRLNRSAATRLRSRFPRRRKPISTS